MNTILLVEDNEDDAFFMRRALIAAGVETPMHIAEDGQQAIDYLAGAGAYSDRALHPLPTIVFLDLKLPLRSGHEVLEWIRQRSDFGKMVVIVLTSSCERVDLERAYGLGANSYVVKPSVGSQFRDMAEAFKGWWLLHNRSF